MKKSEINKQKPKPTSGYVSYDSENIYFKSDGQPSIFYMEYMGDYNNKFESALNNWTFRAKNNKLILFTISTDNAIQQLNKSNLIMKYQGSLKITKFTFGDWEGNKFNAGIKKIDLETIENITTKLLDDKHNKIKDYKNNYNNKPKLDNEFKKKIINKSRIQK
ncbi:MAG: hypothetical protein Unbinned2514contig1001_46 [Prokaryotic dsDNA virus sp.]|nr:MAG: hypothetical protein Unbinned2514contig1001_46 [Prokaryotic dsDNA virus sp.]|tara:strand:- start:1508 stop:1996 length:489 start_codon:yes stop_codon:yes gene_type:complete